MNFDRKVRSLVDLLDDNVVDLLLFDSCALGSELFRHGSPLRLSIEHAERNNVNMRKLREARKIAQISTRVLQHEGTGVAPAIYGEQLQKMSVLRRVVDAYGKKGWHERREGRTYRKHIMRERKILGELLAIHNELIGLIGERIVVDAEEAQGVENLAIEAYKHLGYNEKPKNDHDERLIGDAVYLATRDGLYVGVVTHDHRMMPILKRVQLAVASGNGEARSIREQLEAGKVIIFRELNPKEGFQIEYCSSDFKANGQKVPAVVEEKVEALAL